eukprot:scaffold20268_cov111-Isochrysis_galbana.AAC.3
MLSSSAIRSGVGTQLSSSSEDTSVDTSTGADESADMSRGSDTSMDTSTGADAYPSADAMPCLFMRRPSSPPAEIAACRSIILAASLSMTMRYTCSDRCTLSVRSTTSLQDRYVDSSDSTDKGTIARMT